MRFFKYTGTHSEA